MSENKRFEVGQKVIFLSSWPYGRLIEVIILGERKDIENGWYFRYPHGGSDSTDTDFLFEMPETNNTGKVNHE